MIPALIISLLAIFLSYLSSKNLLKYGLEYSFILIASFLSLGYYWGNDVSTYEDIFEFTTTSGVNVLNFNNYNTISQRYEYGWIAINLICTPLGFWGMRALLFAVENFIIYRLIKHNVPQKWYWLAVFFYTLNPSYMVMSSSMMRQWLAMCMIILSVEFLGKKRYVITILFFILAFLFHKSSIVCILIMIFILGLPQVKKNNLIWFVPLLLIYYGGTKFLLGNFINSIVLHDDFSYLGRYVGSDAEDSFGISKIIFIIINVVLFYDSNRYNRQIKLLFCVFFLYIITAPLMTFTSLASRLSLYFTIFSIVCYPIFMACSTIKKSAKISIISFAALYQVYNFYLFFNSETWSNSYKTYNTLIEAFVL